MSDTTQCAVVCCNTEQGAANGKDVKGVLCYDQDPCVTGAPRCIPCPPQLSIAETTVPPAIATKIDGDQNDLLVKGKGVITITGVVYYENADQEFSIYLCDASKPQKSQNSPLIFTVKFRNGRRNADFVTLQSKANGNLQDLHAHKQKMGIKHARRFAVSFHVKPTDIEVVVNGCWKETVHRQVRMEKADYIVCQGEGLNIHRVKFEKKRWPRNDDDSDDDDNSDDEGRDDRRE
ncbi:uncharacterized protein [Littorina saxatilis]|uniref:uncharacterized protein isoform X2 n=1 Tax=Littorina saxatilis TaxID=31220 RepID=UPI0038B5C34C